MLQRTSTACLAAVALLGVACGDYGGSSSGETSAPQALLSNAASAGGVDAFSQTVYPILRDYCAACHDGSGQGPELGSPHFASPDPTTAYLNTVDQGKMNLAIPESSRLVQKVAGGHNCWVPDVPVAGQDDCETDAAEILAAVIDWADIIDFGEGGVSINETLASSSLMLGDGIQDVGSERYTENLIALYEFKEGDGTVVNDVSGVEPLNHLDLEGDFEWLSAWGVQFANGIARGRQSFKLYDRIADPTTGTGQYTIETWITNANVVQEGPARIVTYSRNANQRNFTLGQEGYNYNFRNRAMVEEIGGNGTPALVTYDADQDAQDRLQHVVITYDQYRGRRIHVDSVWTDDVDEMQPGRLWNWERNNGFTFALGDEVNNEDRHWEGQIRFVAVYDQALTQPQIEQNFAAGVGKRLLMRFDVSQWTTPGSAVEFQVSEFDNYSYLFCSPTYRTSNPLEFRLSNIRIAVNDEIPTTGQGFQTIDTQVVGSPQELSRQCAIVPKGPGGAETDSFTLVFEHLNGFQNLIEDEPPGDLAIPPDPTPRPELGLRDFARVNETMAALTRIDAGSDGPRQAFIELQQQLPSGFDLRAFVSSQQVGIAKLALEYCDLMVETDAALDPGFFDAFPMGVVPEVAFADPADRLTLSDVFYDLFIGDGLADQPTRDGVRQDLEALYTSLLSACTPTEPCDVERTKTMVKGTCAAVLSSAVTSIH